MSKVSVVIPTYNYAKYLNEAINSVLYQTYTDFEIIVIDDGSTDNTKELLAPYIENKKIKYIYQNNQGTSEARNRGIKESNGQYIIFLDADDVWFPSLLEEEVKYLEKNPKVGLVCGNLVVVDENNRLTGRRWRTETGLVNWRLFPENQISSSSALIRKKVFLTNNLWFSKELRNTVDYHMWLRMSKFTKLVVLPKILYLYRRHSRNLTVNLQKTRFNAHDTLDKILDFKNSDGVIDSVYNNERCDFESFNQMTILVKKYINYLKNGKFFTKKEKMIMQNYWDNKLWRLFRNKVDIEKNLKNNILIIKKMNNPFLFLLIKLCAKLKQNTKSLFK